MKINLHKNARTTPALRSLIQNETRMSISDLASKIGVSETTVRKWKKRGFVLDKPHTPKKTATALTPVQELIAVLIRICLRPGLDDLWQMVQAFITPGCSRSGLNRCLKRYHISRLSSLQGDLPVRLDDYRGTFFYYVKIYFPCLPGMKKPFAVQTLIDCTFRCLHAEISVSPRMPRLQFIKQAIQDYPLTILGIIFTDPIILSGTAPVDACTRHAQLIQNFCKVYNLASYYSTPVSELTLDRLRQTCKQVQKQHPATGAADFNLSGLINSGCVYNTSLCQRTLKQKTPKQAMESHYTFFPGSFRQHPKQFTGIPSLMKD